MTIKKYYEVKRLKATFFGGMHNVTDGITMFVDPDFAHSNDMTKLTPWQIRKIRHRLCPVYHENPRTVKCDCDSSWEVSLEN